MMNSFLNDFVYDKCVETRLKDGPLCIFAFHLKNEFIYSKVIQNAEDTHNMAQTFDYPFSNWNSYYAALIESLDGPVDNKLRPNYAEMVSLKGVECDTEIIKCLLEQGNDAQQGLDMFFQSMIDGFRYSHEVIAGIYFPRIIELFLEKGAVINIDILLRANPKYKPHYFEEEMYSYRPRASMLKRIKKGFMPDLVSVLNEKIGWDDIVPVYWEEMLDESGKLDPAFGDFDTARFKALNFEYYAILFGD